MAINESAQTPQEVAAQCEAFKKTYLDLETEAEYQEAVRKR